MSPCACWAALRRAAPRPAPPAAQGMLGTRSLACCPRWRACRQRRSCGWPAAPRTPRAGAGGPETRRLWGKAPAPLPPARSSAAVQGLIRWGWRMGQLVMMLCGCEPGPLGKGPLVPGMQHGQASSAAMQAVVAVGTEPGAPAHQSGRGWACSACPRAAGCCSGSASPGRACPAYVHISLSFSSILAKHDIVGLHLQVAPVHCNSQTGQQCRAGGVKAAPGCGRS